MNLTEEELTVWGIQEEKQFECKIVEFKSSAVICRISGDKGGEIKLDSLRV